MSTAPETRVKVAEARAAAAKARLTITLSELQHRMSPEEIVRGAVDGVRDKSVELAEDALAVAKARPGATAGAAAGVAAFALRKPIGRLVRRLFGRGNESGAPEL